MTPERRASDTAVSRKQCEERHKEERGGRRWAVGLLAGCVLGLTMAFLKVGFAMATTNGIQTQALAERAKGEERILDSIAELRMLILKSRKSDDN